MSTCKNRCYEIGGPWISEDPNCPVHGFEARETQEHTENRISELTEALREVLNKYPSQEVMDDLDDDARSGRRKYAGEAISIKRLKDLRKLLE